MKINNVHDIEYLHIVVTSNISRTQKTLWYSVLFQIFFRCSQWYQDKQRLQLIISNSHVASLAINLDATLSKYTLWSVTCTDKLWTVKRTFSNWQDYSLYRFTVFKRLLVHKIVLKTNHKGNKRRETAQCRDKWHTV